MRLSADLPLVPGDRVQLQQVIINLVHECSGGDGRAGLQPP
jgi:phosphoglycerate-specific signal transduction histidine kinase